MTTQGQRIYNFPVTPKLPTSTPIMRHQSSLKELRSEPAVGIDNLQKLILNSKKLYGKNEFIGTRNPKTGLYEYKTFEEIYKKARYYGSALQYLNLFNEISEGPGKPLLKMIGIYSKNREEWTICDMGNALYGYTMVPLYDTLGPESASFVLGHSELKTCICTSQSIDILAQVNQLHQLKNIITIDKVVNQKSVDILQKRGITFYTFFDITIKGKAAKQPLPQNLKPESVFTFSYTSGTTGNPKGAMITHKNILGSVVNHMNSEFKYTDKDTHISFLPLPHIFERFIQVTCWFSGCRIAFYSGDLLKLREDMAAAKPTVAVMVPRLLNKFYEEINNYVDQSPPSFRDLFRKAVAEKLENIRKQKELQESGKVGLLSSNQPTPVTHPVYDDQVFSKVRAMFGGNFRNIVSGSAPISQKVLDFMKVVFCIPVNQGYGQTEGTGLETVMDNYDFSDQHVGGIQPALELKLEDVPEMGYLSTDKDEQGNYCPRGEICVRGVSIFPGYFRDNEKTKEAIDNEGWLHSGDIGVILSNGALRVIDRKKNIFKLSQGEYISPEKVENIYIRARGVQEAFVHGDSLQDFCVGVLVPKLDEIVKIAKELKIEEKDPVKLCDNQQIKEFYVNSVNAQGKKEGLLSFEQIKKAFLVPQSLSLLGCTTSSFKLQRHMAATVFKKQIQEMYSTPLTQITPKL